MVPRILIDTAAVPGGGELRLFRRGDEFSIMLGANELMNSRLSGSEEALATLVCDRLGGKTAPRLLIGGLGMGFTLRAALGRLGTDAIVTVAELVPAVVAWARGPMAPIFGDCLDDPRTRIEEEDVGALIAAEHGAWDAILLDVDNGPDGLTRRGNDRLYNATGLDAARSALSAGGVLAVWSAAPDAKFVRRLEIAGFAVDEVVVKARAGRGARHVIWLATRL
jgi:spermidine synthase